MAIPHRIASLLASATEILYGIGLGDRVVAVSHECDYPPEVATKPRVTTTLVEAEAPSREIDQQVRSMAAGGSALYGIDTEKLAELAPELIVTQAQCDVCAVRYADVLDAVRTQPALRHSRVVAINPMTLEGIFDDIRTVGEAADCAEAAERYVAGLKTRVEAVQEKSQGISAKSRPRVACIEWIDPPMLAANWMPDLVELAGGTCALVDAGKHSTYANWPDVIAFDPQVIVVTPCGFDLRRTVREAASLEALADWSSMSASRSGRIYLVDGNAYFNRSGPRIVDSLEILAHLIHPEVFDPPDCVVEPVKVWCRLDEVRAAG